MIHDRKELVGLLNGLCNDCLGADENRRLEEILQSDAEARELYHDYIQIHLALVDKGRKSAGFDFTESLANIHELSDQPHVSLSSRGGKGSYSSSGKSVRWNVKLATAAAAACVVLVSCLWFQFGNSSPVATNGTSSGSAVVGSGDLVDQQQSVLFVAQLAHVSPEIKWGSNSTSPDFLLRARLGDRFELESGMLELEYFTGAKVILRGPCDFVVTGPNSGRLDRGNLTGNVDGGGFFVTTPSAKVLDLGTEFGISVSETSATDVCVFDGEVEIYSDRNSDGKGLSLTEGMSASIDPDGQVDPESVVDTEQFAHFVPGSSISNSKEVSLVDLMSAKAKDRFRLAGVIAPDTGKPDQSPWRNPNGPGHRTSNGYVSTHWHPFVDGVFVPTPDGVGVQVDSSGSRFNFPESKGRTWGPVWSRRKFNGESSVGVYESYWGSQTIGGVIARLEECETGMIGIHSSVGVTFDLDAVRNAGFEPSSLSFICSNLDNSMTVKPDFGRMNRFSADVRVFVDGQLRTSRLDFTRTDGELEMVVPLNESDRFLTFASSDCGRDGFDHVVIIDPKLSGSGSNASSQTNQ